MSFKQFLYFVGSLLFAVIVYSQLFSKSYWLADLATSFYYQSLLALVLILLSFSLMRNKNAILVLGCFVLVSFFWFPKEISKEEPVQTEETLRFLQFNLFGDNQKVDVFIDYVLQHASADMLFLQEVSPKIFEQIQSIEKIYPYHSSSKEVMRSQLAVFSRYPFGSHKTLHDGAHYYIRITGKMPHSRKDYVIYNVHLSSPKTLKRWEKRNKALKKMADKLAKEAASYKIILGDFNISVASPWVQELQQRSELQLSTLEGVSSYSWSPVPFKGWWGGVLIDHLLHSQNMLSQSEEIPGDFGSDHLPILSELRY